MSARQQVSRAVELVLLFAVAPALLGWLGAAGHAIPVVALLLAVGGCATAFLLWSSPAELRAVLGGWPARELRRIGFQLVIVGAVLVAYVRWAAPETLFDLPRRGLATWLPFLAAYALFSVLPQELLFRAFFFQRYGPLWSAPGPRIVASGVAFG